MPDPGMALRLRWRRFVAAVTYPATWSNDSSRGLGLTAARARAFSLAAVAMLALALRVTALSTYGLSEDEINKARAIEQYSAGNFAANAEHPMLMKLAMWASTNAAAAWNRVAPPGNTVAVETAIRLPNAVAGAATTLVLFGVADVLFGATAATVASLLWALDVNAIAINRIGKEDTFLLFFFLLGIWCYERAKELGASDRVRAQRWYQSSGASFGLMLASKYMPHYIGFYALFNTITDKTPGTNRPDKLGYYLAMASAFVAANPAILMLQTWRYCSAYVRGTMLTHHGYLYAGQLYVTNIPISPLGVPVDYYLRLIATKVPLVVLAALVPGVIEIVRRRTERGFVLLRVLLVFLLVPYSLMAAKFERYMLPVLSLIDLTAAVGLVSGIGWLLRKQWLAPLTRVAVSAGTIAVTSVAIVAGQQSAEPFYSLFANSVGERLAAPGKTFPDETYDYGVREAVRDIAVAAEPSAVIVSDAPGVVAYYLERSGRLDLRSRALSNPGIPYGPQESWVIVQDEHKTFENAPVVELLRRERPAWERVYARDVVAVEVFRIAGRRL
jgi:hypothetical protein